MQVDPSSAAAPVSKLDMALGDLTKQARRNRHHKRKPKTGGSASSSVAVQPKVELGSKLLVSNLHVAVTEADLKELFGSVGPLKKCSLSFDAKGKSKGTAEVEFVRKNDALLALKKYKDVALDGKPLNLEITTKAPAAVLALESRLSKPGAAKKEGGRGGAGPRGRGRAHRNRPKPKTKEELDAELDSYHKNEDVAMQE